MLSPRAVLEKDASEAQASCGLTTAEAQTQLKLYGPNATPEERLRAWLCALTKFWAPVPWMLEAAVLF